MAVAPDSLLDDARTLAVYANRNGIAVPDEVNRQIETAEAAIKSGRFGVSNEQQLSKAIFSLLSIISPRTLDDVCRAVEMEKRPKWQRFLARARLPAIPTVLNVFCVALTLVIINLTTTFSNINILSADLREVTRADYFSHIDRLRQLTKVDADKMEVSAVQETQNILKNLRDIDGRMIASIHAMSLIYDVEHGQPNWCLISFGTLCSADDGATAPPTERGGGFSQAHASERPSAPSTDRAASPELPSDSDTSNAVAKAPEASAVSGAASALAMPTSMISLMQANAMVAAQAGLSTIAPQQFTALFRLLRQAEGFALFLGGSLLPLLYGVLGAGVFLIRQFYADPSFLARQKAPAGTTFLRLGLGGISGLAIGWFLTPDTSKGLADISALPTAPFAIAFLAGFSIDLLFSLLDRLIASVSPSPAPQANQPATPAPGTQVP